MRREAGSSLAETSRDRPYAPVFPMTKQRRREVRLVPRGWSVLTPLNGHVYLTPHLPPASPTALHSSGGQGTLCFIFVHFYTPVPVLPRPDQLSTGELSFCVAEGKCQKT